MLKNIGTIRIIDPAKQQCSSALETEITFNQKGQKGDRARTASGQGTVWAGGTLALTGSTVALNGGSTCFPAVRVSDGITETDTATGQQFVVALAPGASTVCIEN